MAAKNEARVKFTAETTEFNQNIKESETKMAALRSELKLNSEQMKTSGVSIEGLEAKHEMLKQVLAESENKTKNLSDKLEAAKRIYGENSEEVLRLQSKLNNAAASQENIKRSIQDCTDAIDKQKKAEQESQNQFSKLTNEIGQQESEISKLKKEYVNVVLEQGETSDAAQELAGKINKLSGELGENKQKLNDAQKAADDVAQGYDNLGDSAEDAGKGGQSSAEGFTVAKGAIANLASEAIQQAIDKFKELTIESEKAFDKLQAKTGESKEDMSQYKDVVQDVYGNAWGDSIEECTGALGTVVQMTDDLNKKDLKNITENVMTLADVYDLDYAESMRAVNSLTDQFEISQEEAFNLIVQGAREGLNQNGDLLDVINEYSVQFAQGSLSANDMFNMIANGAGEGVWSIDKMGDAYKEFSIRLSDGTANDYLKNIGLDANEVVEKFRKGGPDAKEALGQISDAIKNCDDKTLAYQTGVGLMGTMWEDMGQDACLALLNTEGSINMTNDAMSQVKTDAYDNVGKSLQQLGRSLNNEIFVPITEKIEPPLNRIIKFAIKHIDVIGPLILGVGTAIGILALAMGAQGLVATLKKASSAFGALNTIMSLNPAVLIVALIAGLVVAFVTLWKKCDGFRKFWTGLWDGITKFFSKAADTLKGGLKGLGEKFGSLKKSASKHMSGMKQTVGEKMSKISDIFKSNGGGIKGTVAVMWAGVKGYYKTGFNVLNKLTGGRLGDLKDTAGKKLGEFHDKFKSVRDKIAGIFDFHLKLPKIKMPSISVSWKTEGTLAKAAQFLDFPGLPHFDVSWHAKGALLTKPTIFGFAGGKFQGGGEAGPEAVLPVSLLEDYIDNSMMKFLAAVPQIDYDRLADCCVKAGEARNLTIVADNREIGRVIDSHVR